MQYAPVLFLVKIISIIVIICIIAAIIHYRKKPISREALKKRIMIVLLIILIVAFSGIIVHRIFHKRWFETIGQIKCEYPEVKEASFSRPTPTTLIEFTIHDSTELEKTEDIFISFLNEFDMALYDEIKRNTFSSSSTSKEIYVYFTYASDNNMSVIDYYTDNLTDWKCEYPSEDNPLYGRQYKKSFN